MKIWVWTTISYYPWKQCKQLISKPASFNNCVHISLNCVGPHIQKNVTNCLDLLLSKFWIISMLIRPVAPLQASSASDRICSKCILCGWDWHWINLNSICKSCDIKKGNIYLSSFLARDSKSSRHQISFSVLLKYFKLMNSL